MKKFISMFTVAMFAVVALVACGSEEPKTEQPSTNETQTETPSEKPAETKIRIGMMTDSGTIDDKSFNQGTWEGIKKYEADKGVDVHYVKPEGEATQDYLNANDNLVMAKYNVIVAPGYKFEEAIFEAQAANPDVKYILI
ncbi:MAG: BMP family lipoprotein, partial [Turicibacter sp.]